MKLNEMINSPEFGNIGGVQIAIQSQANSFVFKQRSSATPATYTFAPEKPRRSSFVYGHGFNDGLMRRARNFESVSMTPLLASNS